MLNAKLWRHFDFWLLGAVALLCIIGIAMIRSTTVTSLDPALQASTERQIIFSLIGAGIVVVFSAIDYRFYGATAPAIYLILLVLLVIVYFVAQATFGAARWIDLGIIRVQPSELGKFLMILTLGHYIVTHKDEIERFAFVLKTLVHIGVPVVLILLQPDLSSCIIYGVVWFTLMWMSGLRWRHLAVLGGAAAVVAVAGFFAALQSERLGYIAQRVIVFFVPDTNSQAYRDAFYNINQALISIGSGGWLGQGYGQGPQVQLRFLKVRHTDFIFSAIGHEFGFVGAVIVMLLFAFVVWRIYRAGQAARDPYGRLICFGVGTVILFEAFSNIASNMQLIPVSGSPLPFISYGGSSLWTFLIGIGLVESVILRHKQIEF